MGVCLMRLKVYLCCKKRAIRAIAPAGYNGHTETLFKFYNVLKVEHRYNYIGC